VHLYGIGIEINSSCWDVNPWPAPAFSESAGHPGRERAIEAWAEYNQFPRAKGRARAGGAVRGYALERENGARRRPALRALRGYRKAPK
jgi:hypothetical protein